MNPDTTMETVKISDLKEPWETFGKANEQIPAEKNDVPLPPMAFIGTGGTVASIGTGPTDLLDYSENRKRMESADVLEFAGLRKFAPGRLTSKLTPIDSTAIEHDNWIKIVQECYKLFKEGKAVKGEKANQGEKKEVKGIVISHGTATLEETAWLLFLILNLKMPIVVTGSMRPLNVMSSDAAINLLQSFYLASHTFDPNAELRALVAINGKIHDPSKVIKTHTAELNAFKGGEIGYVCGDNAKVDLPRSIGLPTPDLGEVERILRKLPRVDIVYSYIDCNDTAVNTFIEKGAKGIISAGFHPGLGTESQDKALERWVEQNRNDNTKGFVVQSTREGDGLVHEGPLLKRRGFIAGNTYNPQKAKILLQVCLAKGLKLEEIKEVFRAQRPEEMLWRS